MGWEVGASEDRTPSSGTPWELASPLEASLASGRSRGSERRSENRKKWRMVKIPISYKFSVRLGCHCTLYIHSVLEGALKLSAHSAVQGRKSILRVYCVVSNSK